MSSITRTQEWHPAMSVEVSTGTRRVVRWLPIGLAVLLVLSAAAVAYGLWEARQLAGEYEGRVAPGIAVDGIDLSGLPWSAAEAALANRAAAELDGPVHLAAADQTVTVTASELGGEANVADVMAQVRTATESLSLRDWVGIRWQGVDASVAARLEVLPARDEQIEALVAGLAQEVHQDPVEASMAYDEESITFHAARDGRALDIATAVPMVKEALAVGEDAATEVTLPTVTTPATTTLADLGQVLYLDQSEHMLYLYDSGELRGEWPVATGAPGYGTPTGEYWVEELRENPTWGNPAPNGWGANMPAFIGPGPTNPLGVRAINWGGTDHIRFHGTHRHWTIGSNASHGCVRLTNEDVVELFDLVQLDATIISVS